MKIVLSAYMTLRRPTKISIRYTDNVSLVLIVKMSKSYQNLIFNLKVGHLLLALSLV
jgi:hypothetical protein